MVVTLGPKLTGRPAALDIAVRAREPRESPDPGDGGTIRADTDGFVLLVSNHAGPGETRTLADPQYEGQTLDLCFEADDGAITMTADSAINQAGNTSLLWEDGGDHLRLVGGRDGAGGLAWRVLANDGVALS